jgi:hypothetical protein
MDDWLLAARTALAEAASLSPDELDLEEDDEATLLELARLAAHESGSRTNAPLLCYLMGLARRGATLDTLAESVTSMRC